MCFSATASFTLATATAVIGIAAIRQVRQPGQLLLASVPLLFAVQQSVEGALWLQLRGEGDPGQVAALSFIYLIFAKVLWPVYTPLTVLLLEPDRRRWRAICAMAVLGLILSIHLFMDILGDPVSAVIRGHSIDYAGDANPISWQQIPYLLCVCLSLLLSSHRVIQVFGSIVLIGFLVSVYVYFATYVSVWCFFAAADSALLYFYFKREAMGARLLHS